MNTCSHRERYNNHLLFANLNCAAVRTQADVWAAFADGGAGRGITALIIDTDAEIIHVNGAVFALGIEPESDFRRHFNLNSSADIVDIDISERRFWANGNQAIAVLHFNRAADFIEMNFIGASIKLDGPGQRGGTYIAVAHGDFAIEL